MGPSRSGKELWEPQEQLKGGGEEVLGLEPGQLAQQTLPLVAEPQAAL